MENKTGLVALPTSPLSIDFDIVGDDGWKDIHEKFEEEYQNIVRSEKGGKGSGYWSHSGRPGKVGGSASGNGKSSGLTKRQLDFIRVIERDYSQIHNQMLNEFIEALDDNFRDDSTRNFITLCAKNLPFALVRFISTASPIDSRLLNSTDETRRYLKDKIAGDVRRASGLDYDMVDTMVRSWANTSNDSSFLSLSLQKTVGEVFGVDLSDWQKSQVEMADGVADQQKPNDIARLDKFLGMYKEGIGYGIRNGEMSDTFVDDIFSDYRVRKEFPTFEGKFTYDEIDNYNAEIKKAWLSRDKEQCFSVLDKFKGEAAERIMYDGILSPNDERKYVTAVYQKTQDFFKQAGYNPEDEITLFRGTSFKPDKWGRNPTEWGKKVSVKGNACSSWSVYPSVAARFGKRQIMAHVKVKDVISTCMTGWGCLNEGEVVVLNRPDTNYYYMYASGE
jgi:hypothetical protein